MQTGYNKQIVVDYKNGLIIATYVTQDGNDQKQFLSMVKQTTGKSTTSTQHVHEEAETLRVTD